MNSDRNAISGAQHRDPVSDRLAMPRAAPAPEFRLSTSEFAQLNCVKDQTVRKRFCLTGSYFGVRPRKLINCRLVWPSIQIGSEGV